MHQERIRRRFTLSLSVAAALCGGIMLAGCLTRHSRVAEPGEMEQTLSALRSQWCTVWVVTNRITGQTRFAANALSTGYVQKLGEHNYDSIAALASAIKSGTFGPSPKVVCTFEGDPRYEDGHGVRNLTRSEQEELTVLGIAILVKH